MRLLCRSCGSCGSCCAPPKSHFIFIWCGVSCWSRRIITSNVWFCVVCIVSHKSSFFDVLDKCFDIKSIKQIVIFRCDNRYLLERRNKIDEFRSKFRQRQIDKKIRQDICIVCSEQNTSLFKEILPNLRVSTTRLTNPHLTYDEENKLCQLFASWSEIRKFFLVN